jgi:hypothetical protein
VIGDVPRRHSFPTLLNEDGCQLLCWYQLEELLRRVPSAGDGGVEAEFGHKPPESSAGFTLGDKCRIRMEARYDKTIQHRSPEGHFASASHR